ncbi:hypothetical protein [Enterococcus sp. AZ163]|uniref:hypothetical protein n=1 Tax=Enterococcus sp. AZ163 TaxID=2774638 RepID=UPI003D2CE80B
MKYEELFDYVASKPNFTSYYNEGDENLQLFQIVSFEIVEDDLDVIKNIVQEIIDSDSQISFYVDDIEMTIKNIELLEENIGEYLEFRVRHDLTDLDYSLIFANVKEFKCFVDECISPLTISRIRKIKNKIGITIKKDTTTNAIGSKLFCDGQRANEYFIGEPSALINEEEFQFNHCLAVPGLLPEFLLADNSRDLLMAFFECISEKEISENEFMLSIGDINSIVIEEDCKLSPNQLRDIFSITNYIFQDSKSYLEKLWILRKKLFDCILEGYSILEIPWKRILLSVKNTYHLLVNERVTDFFDKKEKYDKAITDLVNSISIEINKNIEETIKELLTIVGTILASFALKIDMNQQAFFVSAALLYCVFLYIIYSIRGFNHASEVLEDRIKDLKQNFEKMFLLEESFEEVYDKRISQTLESLRSIEEIRKIFLLLIMFILVLILMLSANVVTVGISC